jgi:hypothetical protein
MADQFVVPQFIDVEDKILGPITVRQFIILLAAGFLLVIFYKLFNFITFIVVGLPILVLAIVLAFVKINGMPFHFFLLNIIQTLRKPNLRVWDKTISKDEAKAKLEKKPEPVTTKKATKAPATTSRLQELSLVVNTGGVYRPEEEETQ